MNEEQVKEWDEVMHYIRTNNRILINRQLNRTYIPVRYDEGENWTFAVIQRSKGVKGIAVF